jgi:lipoate-protein ligase B
VPTPKKRARKEPTKAELAQKYKEAMKKIEEMEKAKAQQVNNRKITILSYIIPVFTNQQAGPPEQQPEEDKPPSETSSAVPPSEPEPVASSSGTFVRNNQLITQL